MTSETAFYFLASNLDRGPFYMYLAGQRVKITDFDTLGVPPSAWKHAKCQELIKDIVESAKAGGKMPPINAVEHEYFILRGHGPAQGPESHKNYDLVVGANDIQGFYWPLGEIEND